MDATHTRLDQMTDALARQSAQLAAIEATVNAPPPVEAEPSYGRPQPRPACEALRSIKRGMTSDEVARLVGAPLSSEGNGSGSFVWDYGYGRTITFDRRNRATSLVGFPAP